MKAGSSGHFEQADNAHARVETESRLIVGARVTAAPNDKAQLAPNVAAIPTTAVGEVRAVLADNGFYSAAAVPTVEADAGPTVSAAVEKSSHHRPVADWEAPPSRPRRRPVPARKSGWRIGCRRGPGGRSTSCANKPSNRSSGSSKKRWAFGGFGCGGLAQAELEWTLVCVAYNLKRLHRLRLAAA